MIEVRVLGPLEVVGADGAVPFPARKQRRLLAALLVAPDVVRPADVLIDALWSDAPPPSAEKLLQVYISQLRKVLPPQVAIQTVGAGYVITLGGARLDAVRFEELLGEARGAARAGNASVAASILRRALDLWRGDAYAEFADAEFVRAQAQRLNELRRLAIEERFTAELDLGRHRAVLPEILSAAAENPLRERLQAHAMLALYRSGRQAEALELYRTTRKSLVEELGVEPGDELRRLQAMMLRQDPALDHTVEAQSPTIDLPAPPNPLRGRGRELRELQVLLGNDDVRLVVLTGAGGSGKTRLAVELARCVAERFADGVAFVPLATVREADLAPAVVASALGAPPTSDQPLDALIAHLRGREMLLVLDNFEQLRSAGPALVVLMEKAPRLKIMVTSRVVLHVSGEHVYPVEPLPAVAAADLFVERARTADPRLDCFDPGTIDALCQRLDRLPLAIELAASHLRALTPAELLKRLDTRLPLLSDGPHDLPARQQTLRSTLEWSFDQLDDGARRDLAALSVFAGGWTMDAAAEVLDAKDVAPQRVRGLLDHSLVVRTATADGSRFAMLETVREFAAERLLAPGDADADVFRRRHAEYSLRLAQSFNLSIDSLGTPTPKRYDAAIVEQDNMRAALDWAAEHDPLLGLSLMAALEQFWVTNNPRESVRRLTELLDAAGDIPLDVRARALRDLGGCNEVSGDWEAAGEHYQRSLDLYRQIGDEAGELRLMHRVTLIAFVRGDLDAAKEVTDDGLRRASAGGFRYERSELLRSASVIAFRTGEPELAYQLERESLELLRGIGPWAWGETSRLRTMAEIASHLGWHARADEHGREALAIARLSGDRIKSLIALAALALVAVRAGDVERAGRIWGAIESEERRSFLGWWTTYRSRYDEVVKAGAVASFEEARAAGREVPLDDMIDEALARPVVVG